MALGKSLKIQGVSGEGVCGVQDDVSLPGRTAAPVHRMMGTGARSPVFWPVVKSKLYLAKQTQELGYSTLGHVEEASH